jgi:peptide/nickel transport system permease protein
LLPSLALAALPAAEIARQLRATVIETLDSDYVLAARAKGVSEGKILIKHTLKNAAIPPMTVLGFRIAQTFGGAVIIERLFVMPGIGSLTVQAVFANDYPVVLGVVVVTAVVVATVNLLVDASYSYFNPKVRLS